MIINTLIMGNNASSVNTLECIIKEYKKDWNIFKAYSIADAADILLHKSVNLIFSDIEHEQYGMPYLLDNIREIYKYKNVPIIFTTPFDERIFKTINTIHRFNYIIKPYTKSDVRKSIDNFNYIYGDKKNTITIRTESGIYTTVAYNSVLYIESERHNAVFHTTEGILRYNHRPLGSILEMLDSRFIRIHKRYIINTDYIAYYDRTNRYITIDDFHLSVGRTFKKEFETAYWGC